MISFQQRSISFKILVIIGLVGFVIIAFVFGFYYFDTRAKIINSNVEKARALCLNLENVKAEISELWNDKTITTETLKTYAAEGKIEKIYNAIPIVSAWQSAFRGKEEGNYDFRVPSFDHRNPDNTPDDVEARILRKMETEELDEYWFVDSEMDAIRYFRPIKIDQSCLVCHGDPGQSSVIWGNNNGTDVTDFKMEGWEAGKYHGAFETIQPLAKVNGALMASLGWFALFVIVLMVAAGVGLVFLIQILINKPLIQIAQNIDMTAEELAGASNEVAASSTDIAAGASDQAATLEQISSSLTEIASSTKVNAENTTEADNLSYKTLDSLQGGRSTIEAMKKAIDQIKTSSDETVKIVKAIEEIAFQTNLLSLNAAVEAARAGEAGKGFAVVAEEVRNLAQRSAKAARDSGSLLSESKEHADRGVSVSEEVLKLLEAVEKEIQKISDVLSDVSRSSNQQAEGVAEITTSVQNIENVTQNNSSNSEETAATAEELSGQVHGLKSMAGNLLKMVKGENK